MHKENMNLENCKCSYQNAEPNAFASILWYLEAKMQICKYRVRWYAYCIQLYIVDHATIEIYATW